MLNQVDPLTFRDALSRWASGVTIVTCRSTGGVLQGFTASSFSSLSLDPPLVLVCLDKRAGSHPAFVEASSWAISVLAADQAELALQLASHAPDKFEGVEMIAGVVTGLPLFAGAIAHLECRAHERLSGGDHTILVGEVLRAEVYEGAPLLHYRRSFGGFQPG